MRLLLLSIVALCFVDLGQSAPRDTPITSMFAALQNECKNQTLLKEAQPVVAGCSNWNATSNSTSEDKLCTLYFIALSAYCNHGEGIINKKASYSMDVICPKEGNSLIPKQVPQDNSVHEFFKLDNSCLMLCREAGEVSHWCNKIHELVVHVKLPITDYKGKGNAIESKTTSVINSATKISSMVTNPNTASKLSGGSDAPGEDQDKAPKLSPGNGQPAGNQDNASKLSGEKGQPAGNQDNASKLSGEKGQPAGNQDNPSKLSGGSGSPVGNQDKAPKLLGGIGQSAGNQDVGSKLSGGNGQPAGNQDNASKVSGGNRQPAGNQDKVSKLSGENGQPAGNQDNASKLSEGNGQPAGNQDKISKLSGENGQTVENQDKPSKLTGGSGPPAGNQDEETKLPGANGQPKENEDEASYASKEDNVDNNITEQSNVLEQDQNGASDTKNIDGADNSPALADDIQSQQAQPENAQELEQIAPISQNTNLDGDSYFFTYFMIISMMIIIGYITYHNKQKILALALEGRRGKRQYRSRRPNTANYQKLDNNLEEAMSSTCNKNTSHIIY